MPVPPLAMPTVPSDSVGFCPPDDESGPLAATESTPVLASVMDDPSATRPPPDRPAPALTVSDEFASMVLSTPPLAIAIVPRP